MTHQAQIYKALKNFDDNVVSVEGFKAVTFDGRLRVLPLTIQIDSVDLNDPYTIIITNDILHGTMTATSNSHPGEIKLDASMNRTLFQMLEDVYSNIWFSRRYEEMRGYTLSCTSM